MKSLRPGLVEAARASGKISYCLLDARNSKQTLRVCHQKENTVPSLFLTSEYYEKELIIKCCPNSHNVVGWHSFYLLFCLRILPATGVQIVAEKNVFVKWIK